MFQQNLVSENNFESENFFPQRFGKFSENLKILWAKRFYVLVIFYLMFAFKRRRPCHELNFMVWQSSVV